MSKKFQRTIEDFVCGHCGLGVTGNGYTNHCPNCLWSCHVDINPGDRAAGCSSLMEPIGLVIKGADWIIVQRCLKCAKIIKNKVAKGDNRQVLVELSQKNLSNIS